MKRVSLLIIFALVITIGIAVALFTLRKITPELTRDKIDALCFYYINIDQIAKKGAFDTHFSAEQRKLLASVLKNQMDDAEVAQRLESIITDVNNSGIDFTKPIYCYMDSIESGFVCVAEVVDINKLDELIKLLFTSDDNITYEKIDDYCYVNISDDICVGYTEDRFIAVFNSCNATATLTNALSRNLADLTIFGDADMASYINLNKALDIIEANTTDSNGSPTGLNELITNIRTKLTAEANVTTTTSFEDGRIVVDQRINGADLSSYREFFHKGENNHLNYVNNNALAVVNLGINGAKLAELFNAIISNPQVREMANLGNEASIYLAVVNDVIESINGDVTIALESIEGKVVEKIDYYWGGTMYSPIINDIKASVMADVADSYIISNVPYFTMGLLRKIGDNHYNAKFANYNFTLQQNDANLLFAGINTKLEPAISSALEKQWATELEEALAYIIIDFDSLTSSSFIESASKVFLDNEAYAIYNSFMPTLSYAYVAVMESDHNQAIVAFDNKEENALMQLSDILLPIVVAEINKSLL